MVKLREVVGGVDYGHCRLWTLLVGLKNNMKVMIIYFNATFRRYSLVNSNTFYKCWVGNTANSRPGWKEYSPFSQQHYDAMAFQLGATVNFYSSQKILTDSTRRIYLPRA